MIKKTYNLISKIYSFIISFFENLFLRKTSPSSDLLKLGYEIVKLKGSLNYSESLSESVDVNKFMKKDILQKKEILELVNNVFIVSGLKKEITDKTGFNYSIDYMILYETYPLTITEEKKQWYANHWHKDKPFSLNTVKVIIPIENAIDRDDGGIEIQSIENSQHYEEKNLDNNSFYRMQASLDEALIFLPNLCYHRAGNPKIKKRKQVMFQLNPSKSWKINNNLKIKQNHIEPKFPFFSYMFDQYEYLK